MFTNPLQPWFVACHKGGTSVTLKAAVVAGLPDIVAPRTGTFGHTSQFLLRVVSTVGAMLRAGQLSYSASAE